MDSNTLELSKSIQIAILTYTLSSINTSLSNLSDHIGKHSEEVISIFEQLQSVGDAITLLLANTSKKNVSSPTKQQPVISQRK